MKISVLQSDFSKALNTASRFASVRSQLPILENILLRTTPGKLLVGSTNLEVSSAVTVGAKVEEKGEIAVPSKLVTEIVSNLKAETVELSAKEEILKITTPQFSSSLSGINTAEFPEIHTGIGKSAVDLSKDFVNSLYQTLFAASLDETRPILTGVLFVFRKGGLIIVATDGFRLSQVRLKGNWKEEKKIIIPRTVLLELLKNPKEELFFAHDKESNQVIFSMDNTTLSSRVMEGEFPNYEKIIPKESKIKVVCDKEEFLRAVKLASVFARDSANVVKLKVEDGLLAFSSEAKAYGKQNTRIEAETEGENLEIAFNFRFLEGFANSVKGESIEMRFSEANSPGVFLDLSEANYLHLIMPVKLTT